MHKLYNNSSREPTHAERVAFLQVWLCRYILCVPSLKPSMAYLPIAHELAHCALQQIPSNPNSPPAQTGVIRGASSCKRPVLDPLERPDDDDNAPPLIRRKDILKLLVVQELIRPDKDESSQASESLSDTRPPSSSKVTDESANEDADAILRSIQDLFTSWEQVKASHVARSSFG
ncbi:hypothetical protein Adt_12062 [Abeliophyllum distichum]|uniref:Aminotransferase-like plant mobile domain-containing protein n=1 Tax=Abeliophyllum distichum TaxID=126358 RepID=A0ABD1UPN8_9LAMI